jgi:glycosyltransferase involved in cell wall biosynthesis
MITHSTHIFLSILTHESRLEKICRTTLKLKLVEKVEVLGLWESGLKKTESFGDLHYTRIATFSKTRPVKYRWLKMLLAILSFLQYQAIVVLKIWKAKPRYTVIHNAALLPVGFFAAKLVRSKVIYEPHELESKQTGRNRVVGSVIRNVEKLFIGSCHSVVTVCQPIADFYRLTFGIPDQRLFVVTNQPENPYYGQDYPRTDMFRNLFNIPQYAIIYLYQGGLDKSRGIQECLDTFSAMNSNHHIVFMGYGPMEEDICKYSVAYSNIHFKSAVPVAEILKYTASADVGLFVIPDPAISESYRSSLPNKFFEYAIAGLHICISDNFEWMSQILIKEQLGTVIGSNKSDLENWMLSINKERVTQLSEKSRSFRRNVGWQGEEQKYNLIYRTQT